jgi:3-oxocholest-4-en-26-oyl-CoA dehydrogenase alpha subunit
VQRNLARVAAGLEYLQLLNWRLASTASTGPIHPGDASALKVFGSEFYLEAVRLLMEVVGTDAAVAAGSPDAPPLVSLEAAMRWNLAATFGGGTNEVQREIIGRTALGVARPAR